MSTETAEQAIVDNSVLSKLQDNLHELLYDLRCNGYKAGIDQYLSAQSLFITWQQQTLTQQTLRASLAALFSISTDEQQRFQAIYKSWYQRYGQQQQKTAERLSQPPQWSNTPRIARSVRLLAGVLFVLVTVIIFLEKQPSPPQDLSDESITVATEETVTEKQPEQHKVQQFIPAPHMPAEPVIAPVYYMPWSSRLQNLQWLPLVWFMFWLALRCYQRYLTLSRQHSQKDQPVRLEALRLKQTSIALFPASALKSVLRNWRSYIPFRSHRLNESETVRQTLEGNGYVQVVYKHRLLPPEHVLLIDRRHYDDYAARLGVELQQRLQQEGLFVSCYQYDADPGYCWPISGTGRYFSVAELADRHQGQSLLVVGDASTFYRGHQQRQINWGGKTAWLRKTLLSINTPDDWGHHETKLMQAGFRVTPFTRRGLVQLIDSFQPELAEQAIDAARSLDDRDASLPSVLCSYAADWLEEQVPTRQQRKTIIAALKTYLGYEGYCLLAAIASYPTLDWRLTQALDAQMQQRDGEEREIRLRKLSRLPWLRGGRIPDVWRKWLIRSVDKIMLGKINEAYQALLNYQDGEVMDLPVAIPDYQSAQAAQNESVNAAKQGDPLQDVVFASVIRGRKPKLLEFTLPGMIEQWMPPQYWRGLLAPTLARALLAAFLIYGLHQSWQQWAVHWQQDLANQAMQTDLAAYQVKVIYTDKALDFHAQTLQDRLQMWGFQSTFELQKTDSVSTATTENTNIAQDANRIEYAGVLTDKALQLAKERLRYLTFAARVVEIKDDAIASNEIIIRLQKAYQAGAVYRDSIQPQLLNNSHRDMLQDGSLGPAMVKIEPGCFQMGSAESDKKAFKTEKPQRKVCIQQPFYLGQYEVSFAEYDLFAKATKRELPTDEDWGRNDRPVINVSWKDAMAYIEWLSAQTGKNYRLPSEAEWEYAARAGTTTAFWWGDKIEKGMAVCDGCGSRWDNKTTAPMGSFAPNTFGLYDTAGNVWEWLQDCYQDDYEGAPNDGSVWEQAENVSCVRVLRGGSWDDQPQNVRSATRSGVAPDTRGSAVGFRLAQDLK